MKRTARIAGLLYLIMAVAAVFSLQYTPRHLIVRDDAAVTAQNILSHEMLFRLHLVSELFYATLFIFVARTLYRLLSGVDPWHASLMVTLALLSVPISYVNVVNELAALMLLHRPAFLSVVDPRQLEALALFFLRLHGQGIVVVQIFWGLWLFPFGLLVMRSGFLPRILGVLLIVNSFTYPIVTLTALLAPDSVAVVNRIALLPDTGELWIILWLLIKGVSDEGGRLSPLRAA